MTAVKKKEKTFSRCRECKHAYLMIPKSRVMIALCKVDNLRYVANATNTCKSFEQRRTPEIINEMIYL